MKKNEICLDKVILKEIQQIGQRKRRKGNTYHGSHQNGGRKRYERSSRRSKKDRKPRRQL